MILEELEKLVRHETEWLRYYAHRDSRNSLTEESEIYEHLIPIGYTKRSVVLKRDHPLVNRCSPGMITSDKPIVNGLDVSELEQATFPYDPENNRYTPLEAYLILFPEKKLEVIKSIQKLNK